MCDVNSEAVQEIAKAIAEKTDDECQRAVLAFEHAQNAVAYRYPCNVILARNVFLARF